jgi:hypothetical protein
VSESLPVELNGESVHAVDAPESFTARGPFHLELSNAGGAVHVHVRLDEELSAAVQLREVNHYVETGETVRVPVGAVPGHGEVTGHLDVVSGYGAERERIRVTVAADTGADDPGADRAADASAAGGRAAERSTTGTGVRGLVNRSPSTVPVPAASRETAAFAGLSAVVVAVGAAVALTVGELGVALVVAAVVAAVVAVTGWLLLR